ncbi:hypothetical protein GHT07_17595 [Caenimonas koreensis DSM 17982]|uniref:DUF1468 domain-containing protein n=1 Tax=Caenimonas koreensis DSM 17982 TaxID=1121255 RepID=A0A844B7F3_9BURK|nr:tripartite tricarboxylate transporter TctB family protein [Caenimonas koreensis]MRD49093.1 hypothetical protein [Caenimonas koreensis DSM 17982]
MTESSHDNPLPATSSNDEERRPPQSDLKDAIGWTALGIAIVIGSVTMDRLERQNINPYTAPGLLPGLLGLVMILLGVVLFIRSIERGAFKSAALPSTALEREERKRVGIATLLCLGYSVVLVGHGIPFWLASTIYVTASILIFRRMSGYEAERKFSARSLVSALVIGAAASVITFIVFEKLFLVRLP